MRPNRRLAILADGYLAKPESKSARGVLRYSPQNVAAVIDATCAGATALDICGAGAGVPVVADLKEALQYHPTTLLLGIATRGGALPPQWRAVLIDALRSGLDIENGLHTMLSEDPELAALAKEHGGQLYDLRRTPSEFHRMPTLEPFGAKVVHTVGSDCNVGKMTAALELRKTARQRGWKASFAATGQTGIMIEGWGLAVDRVISDFVAGATEKLVAQAAEDHELVFVEGQGALIHPAFSAVTLGLLHGARPDALVLVHQAGRERIRGFEQHPIPPLPELIQLHEAVAAPVHPAQVVGIALNTAGLDETAARQAIAQAASETGLVATDPARFGADELLDAVLAALR